jgi:hypothetical protein
MALDQILFAVAGALLILSFLWWFAEAWREYERHCDGNFDYEKDCHYEGADRCGNCSKCETKYGDIPYYARKWN